MRGVRLCILLIGSWLVLSGCTGQAPSDLPTLVDIQSVEELRRLVDEALASGELTTIVAKVEPVGPDSYFIDPHMLENRFEFERALRQMGDSKPVGGISE